MTITETTTADSTTDGPTPPIVIHWVCPCDVDVALCGWIDFEGDAGTAPPVPNIRCVVCDDLYDQPCPGCGS